MPASRRIIITVSEKLLSEVDGIMEFECKNRSQVVREAIKFYLRERKRVLTVEQMKKGYLEMAEINLGLACEDIEIEESLYHIKEKLLE